ncbi:membrane protein insertase YidC [Mycoplasma sp. ES3157-GEN-MYC]|uniref:Membrane protein insertase YidC n=1 Tax=Mycoplasma miroungigenitalium TaxID=754515 RepID=A0A6M4J956_9MOLU|nr:membrane protein insertase YidC [Mycoplasma miroungigenitalium]MBU4690438.1 membrane protein insertase YidC [Mycoplasma miroungigenitalium]QJR43533.1 membrane protein insertase YidC [Mycoplasma miroungigenitalium]
MRDRSNNFDFFKGKNNNQGPSKKKAVWKKVWLVTKIILYVLLFALTLTGCIQTMVIKSSNYTGAGTEFYDSQAKISPTVSTFIKKTAKNDTNNMKTGEYYEITYSPESNYHLAYKNYSDVIESLRKQAVQDGGKYGENGEFSSSIRFVDENLNETPIVTGETPNRYLYINSTAKNYQSIYKNWTSFKYLDTDFSLKAIIGEKQEDGLYPINNKSLAIYHPENEELVVKKASLFTVYNDQEGYQNLPFQKYGRDVLEFLYRNTFVNNKYYDDAFNGKTYAEFMQSIIDGKKTTLSEKEYVALTRYHKVMDSYLDATLLKHTNTKLPLIDKFGVQLYDENGQKKISSLSTPESVIGAPSYAVKNTIPYAAAEPQISFYSFKSTLSYGPFFSFVIWPIAWLTFSVRTPLPDAHGWSTFLVLLIAVIITRLIVLAITWKATMSQSIQEELRVRKAKIDAKYAEFKGNKEMKMRQQQEISELYKKNGVSPMDAILSMIISFPIFIAMWRVIQSVPELKSTQFLGFDFAAVSYKRLFAGEYLYLILLILTAGTQFMSMFVPRLLNKRKTKHLSIEQRAAMRKSDKMQWIMMVVFVFITLIFTAGVQIYWFLTSAWSILQAVAIHFFKKSNFYKKRYNKKIIA